MTDDTSEFEKQRAKDLRSMAEDSEVVRLSNELITASDRHNFSYVWDWLGLPIIQMPSEIVAIQEIVWRCRPEVIVETGIARGGSLIFYASMLQLIGQGTVVGIDIDLRPHNRRRIEDHPLAHRVKLIDGSSIDPEVISDVEVLTTHKKTMVILDSNHEHAHVLAELNAYGPLVSVGQYLVVADTVVEDIPNQSHRPRSWGPGNNPKTALDEYLASCDRFRIDPEINSKLLLSSSRGGFLRCVG